MSPRQRQLWLWSSAIVAGTAVATVLVVQLGRRRDTSVLDPRRSVSTEYLDAAIALDSPVRFTDVTAAAGICMDPLEPPRNRTLPEDSGAGLAWGDFDGDGWPDLYVVRHTGGSRLFRNNGDGTFTDVTAKAGVGNRSHWGMGATWVDFDGDGHLDLYVTNRGPNRLYRNRGDGTFEDVARAAGVADSHWGTGTAWGDFDADGQIDFYLCNYVSYDSDGLRAVQPPVSTRGNYEAPFTINPSSYDPQSNRLYRNRGDGTFEDVALAAHVDDAEGRSLGATFCDLDGDGWLDLYVNNDNSRDRLFRNLGADPGQRGRFVDISAAAGTADPRSSMGLALASFGDLVANSAGLPDLFITHWVAEGNAFYVSHRTPAGTLEYRDAARAVGLGEISLRHVGWGCGVADFDLDGRPDIAVANGSTLEQERDPTLLKSEPMFVFMNDGTGFCDVAALAGDATRAARNARGLAIADYNHDGKPDIAITTTEGRVVLLRNDTETTNRALTVRLRGRAAQLFGAKVEVWAGGKRQIRWYGADVSYLSQHGSDLIFGLGAQAVADRIRVHWVGGAESTLEHVNAGIVTMDSTPPAPAKGGGAHTRAESMSDPGRETPAIAAKLRNAPRLTSSPPACVGGRRTSK